MNMKFGLGDEFEIQADGRVAALETGPFIEEGPMLEELRRRLLPLLEEPLPPLILSELGGGGGGT